MSLISTSGSDVCKADIASATEATERTSAPKLSSSATNASRASASSSTTSTHVLFSRWWTAPECGSNGVGGTVFTLGGKLDGVGSISSGSISSAGIGRTRVKVEP